MVYIAAVSLILNVVLSTLLLIYYTEFKAIESYVHKLQGYKK